jgi:hypothetical protein
MVMHGEGVGMAQPIQPGMWIRPSPRATYRKLSDGAGGVLLHLDTAAYHGLNEVGALVWSLLGPGIPFGELMSLLSHELVDAPPTLEDEIASFLRSLEERGLVMVEDPTDQGDVR